MTWTMYNKTVTDFNRWNVEDMTKAFDNFEQLKAAGNEWQKLDTVTLEWALCRADDMAFCAEMCDDAKVRANEKNEIREMFLPVRNEVQRRNA